MTSEPTSPGCSMSSEGNTNTSPGTEPPRHGRCDGSMPASATGPELPGGGSCGGPEHARSQAERAQPVIRARIAPPPLMSHPAIVDGTTQTLSRFEGREPTP